MRTKTLVGLIWIFLYGLTLVSGNTAVTQPRSATNASRLSGSENIFDLMDFGAVGDGVTDDGPALQNALNAICEAGGGTLFVPAGRYAIVTPVVKNFSGLATVTISGVESSTVVPSPTANGAEQAQSLDLVSEFLPKTGDQAVAITISGLQNFTIKDISFLGTPDVLTDALITLSLIDIWEATISHCEFYGLSSWVNGGGIVLAVRSHLKIEQTKFLGSFCPVGYYCSVVQNLEWKGIEIFNVAFVDYGLRPGYYGKSYLGATFSWISIGNATQPQNNSPRREVVLRNLMLDEGGYHGITSLTTRYQPPSAKIDLVYITGMLINVSNFGQTGHFFYGLENVLIEKSHYGWSHYAAAALSFNRVGNAILDEVECVDSANRIEADATTDKLTLINSIYTVLDSDAQITKVITTDTAEADPVQYVRQKFLEIPGREPDAAAHFYWSNLILQCGDTVTCIAAQRAALVDYLNTGPSANFSISGQVKDENGAALPGAAVTLSGSQSVATQTDSQGRYSFSKLPTSGVYTVTPSRVNYTFNPPTHTFTTPNDNQAADIAATLDRYTISGRVLNSTGQSLSGATVQLSGSQTGALITGPSGDYSFNVPAEGNYTLTASKVNYVFAPASKIYNNLGGNQTGNFSGSLVSHRVSGQITNDGQGISGITISLSGSQSAIATTDAAGNYSFTLTAEGNYTITPSRTHYTFVPNRQTFNNLGVNQIANFAATLNRHAIGGRVTHDGSGLSGVTLSLSGSLTRTTTTDAEGNYSFDNLAAGGNYTLAATKVNYNVSPPVFSFPDLSVDQTVNFTTSLIPYALSGVVTSEGRGLSGVTINLSGSQVATATTDTSGQYSFSVPAGNYTLTPSKTNYVFDRASAVFNQLSGSQIANFVGTVQRIMEFSAASYIVSEGARTITVTVMRTGDASTAAEVTYSASNGSAEQRSDVIPVIGRLSFGPGETSKNFIIFITDDALVEGNESLTLKLSKLVGGTPGNNSSATLVITDNDSAAADNPIDDAQFFVRQHYGDFLGRRPDTDGLAFWSNQIASCGTDTACLADRRMNVSAAFFLSIEFQQTGFLIYRLYQASFAQPPQHLDEFLLDTRTIGQGVVVNGPGWEQLLEANKTAFIENFVARPRFSESYRLGLTPAEFVNLLNSKAGSALTPNDAAAAVEEFRGAATSDDRAARARVLRRVAESDTFSRRELNPAFVLMQYFGYLQRNPYETPDINLDGYNFWLRKLEEFGGDFRRAEMVKSFLISAEYRARFGAP